MTGEAEFGVRLCPSVSDPYIKDSSSFFQTKIGNIFRALATFEKGTYKMTIDYVFPDNIERLISVRLNQGTDNHLDAWAPYND
uniref:Calpain_III domain-containing protein n=1 Tax=Caenorhabditis tropicalis TaxID=1561998 RepID=A0A1I7TTN4_9PELO